MPAKKALEQAEAEATEQPKHMFTWKGGAGQEITLTIPKRIKRGKVARALSGGDMFAAFDLIFTPDEVEAIEEIEFDGDEWADFQERLWNAIGSGAPKN